MSTKVGWATLLDGKPASWGTLFEDKRPEDFGTYPSNYVRFADYIVSKVYGELIQKHCPDEIVVEETNANSRSAYSQKILEFIHYALIDRLLVSQQHGPGIKLTYVRTGEWRKTVEAKQNAEEKRLNAKISREKIKRNKAIDSDLSLTPEEKAKRKRLPIKIDGKVVGRKGRKHVAIRVVKELYGIELLRKDEDAADAILLGTAYGKGVSASDGVMGRRQETEESAA